MLLLLFIILTLITGLIIPMILIINMLLFEYGMALLCDCVLFSFVFSFFLLAVLNLSAEKCTTTETNSTMEETFSSSFSTKRNVLPLLSQKQAGLFSWWNPATPAPHPPKERCTDERSSIFATEETVSFVQRGFEIFLTFQKSESQVSYLPSHLHWYVFDFEIELKKKF